MKDFYHIIIKENGTIIHNFFASSHDDLVRKYLTNDDIRKNNFFKCMYTPKSGHRLDDVDNYVLINSGMYYPDWFDEELKEKTLVKLKKLIVSMIVGGRKKLLLHEGVILNSMSVIDEVKHSIIFGMYDDSTINILDDASEVRIMTDNSTIQLMNDGSKVENMYGFAKVKELRDYSKIVNMYGRAKIGKMYDNSRICILKGDSKIREMYDDAHADKLKHMSRVEEMHGHSIIEEMWDWSIVEKMFEYAKINLMDEDSKVLEMYGDSMVEQMFGNSIVERLYENGLVRKLHNAAKILSKEL